MLIVPDFIALSPDIEPVTKLVYGYLYNNIVDDIKGKVTAQKISRGLALPVEVVKLSLQELETKEILFDFYENTESFSLFGNTKKVTKQRLATEFFKHNNPIIKSQTDIQVAFTKAEVESLQADFDCKEEVRYWINKRIEWLMTNEKEVGKRSRNDYLAILRWRDKEIGGGNVFSVTAGEKPGYYKSWVVERAISRGE